MQAAMQTPFAQDGVPFGVLQMVPHAPQLLVLVRVFTHVPLHMVWPDGHCDAGTLQSAPVHPTSHTQMPPVWVPCPEQVAVWDAHIPAAHVWPAEHA
jgi:hypothetical protein